MGSGNVDDASVASKETGDSDSTDNGLDISISDIDTVDVFGPPVTRPRTQDEERVAITSESLSAGKVFVAFDPRKHRAVTGSTVAFLLIGVMAFFLFLTLVASCVAAALGQKEMVETLFRFFNVWFTALSTLIASAVAFYFKDPPSQR